MTDQSTPPLRLDLIAEFRAWSKGMDLTELVMRKRNHPIYSTITLAELQEVRRQVDLEVDAARDKAFALAAKVVIAMRERDYPSRTKTVLLTTSAPCAPAADHSPAGPA